MWRILRWGFARAAASVLTAAAVTALPARAELTFTQSLADAGQVRSGTPLTHTFHFTNAGPGTVEVTEVRASCGCLTPTVNKRVLQPGEAGELTLEVNTLSQSAGGHRWRVFFTYRHEGRLYQTTLQLAATLITEVTVQPATLTLFVDNAVSHEVLVTDLRAKPLAIAELRTSSPQVKSRLAGAYRDGLGHQVQRIQLEVADDYPEGRREEVLNIITDDATYHDLRVPVTIVKRGRQSIAVVPADVQLTLAAEQDIASKTVLVRDGSGRQVAVEHASADHPAVVCQWARGPGAMTTLRINVARERVQGNQLQATVQVKVAQPEARTLTIPVTCNVH